MNADPLAGARLFLYEHNRPDLAERELRNHSTELADNAEALAMLGYCVYRRENIQEARSLLERSLQINPESAHAMYWLAEIELAAKRFAVAEDLAREAICRNNNEAVYHALLAQILRVRGRKQKALVEAEIALSISPQHVFCLLVKAELLLDLQRNRGAIKILNQAVQLDPLDAWIHVLFHTAKVETWEYKGAKRHLELAMELAPADPNVQRYFAEQKNSQHGIISGSPLD